MAFQKPRGTQDFLPGSVERWQFVEQAARELCQQFNYKEVRTPIFEQTELFRRGVGDTSDIVEKEMYTFDDKGKDSMTLRPEGTAGVVRAYVENKLFAEPDVVKLYYVGPMFRYERPQAGRYRQFHQFGVEAFGADDPAIDAEVIALGYSFYERVGIKGVRVVLNSVGTPACRAAYREQLLAYLQPMKDELCADCQSRFERNPLRILDCKKDHHKFTNAPSIIDSLSEECVAHFAKVQQHLQDLGIPFELDPTLVRGLDYYTHTAFEYKCEGIGAIDTIGGGGRYNGLVGLIGGNDQPGVGLAVGLERIMLVLEKQAVELAVQKPLDVYFVTMGEAAERKAVSLLHELRSFGLAADKDYLGKKMKGQMKAADRSTARYAAILGDDELEKGEIAVKPLDTDDEQQTMKIEQFIQFMKSQVKE